MLQWLTVNDPLLQSHRLLLVVLAGLLLLPACAEPTDPAPGDNLLPPLRSRQGWKMNHAAPAQAALTREDSAVRITVATAGNQASDVSLAYEGAALQDGRTYTLRFRARADTPRPLEVSGQAGSDPLGLQQQVALTTDWQASQIVWTAHVRPGAALSVPQFRLGQTAGSVWLADVALLAGKDAIAGINLVAPITTAGNWQFVLAGSARGTMTADGSGGALFAMDAVDGTDWHAMFWFTDLDLHDGHSYVLRYRARADAPRHITAKAQVDGGDYHPIGLNEDVSLTTDWKPYTHTFQAAKTGQGNNQIVFLLGQQAGRVWLSDISLTDASAPTATAPNVPPAATAAQKPVSEKPGPGEIALGGAVTEVRVAQRSVTLAVTSVILPDGTTTTFPTPRPKTVLIPSGSVIQTMPATSPRSLADITVGAKVRVVGKDGGPGKPLTARLIAL